MPTDKLDDLFDKYVGGSSIFLNRNVLRHDFIPEVLPHRGNEILKFASILAPSLMNTKCSNLLVYGKPGTGKTAVTRYVLERLSKKGGSVVRNIGVCYVNCRKTGTEYRVISGMCSTVGVKVPFTGLATAEILDRFKAGLEKFGCTFIVALDEIDLLVKHYGDGILYKLTRINEELKSSQLSVVGISNDLYFKDMLDPRVSSSLSEEEIIFKPYTAEQIRDILLQRVKLAFQQNTFPESTLNLCAAIAAAEHGDARRALDLVRVSGEVAERSGANMVREEYVHEARSKIEHDRVAEVLNSLPLHAKVLLYVLHLEEVSSKRGVTTGDLYESYRKFCSKLGVDALTQRRVSGILSELGVLGVINSQIASLGRYGRTKKIRVNVAQQTLKNVFSNDPRLGEPTSFSRLEGIQLIQP